MTDGEREERRRTNLGRGLEALFGEDEPAYAPLDRLRERHVVPIEQLRPNPFQPRRRFAEEDLEGLTASIREKGVLQPILVRPAPGAPDHYEIIAGERRWRAAQRVPLHEIPVVVRELDDATSLQIAIIENVQRQDLTPLEEAEAYQRLIREFRHSQEDLARIVGKSRSHVANTLRLLDLPEAVREHLQEGRITAGHARALLTAADPVAAAHEVIGRSLNVRQTESLAREGGPAQRRPRAGSPEPGGPGGPGGKDPDTLALEAEMGNLLGLRVSISPMGAGGSLTIHYQTLEQLDDVLHRLSHGHRGSGQA